MNTNTGFSPWLRITLFTAVALLAPAALQAQPILSDEEPPPPPPNRIVVKLKPALARTVEQALPAGEPALRGPFPRALEVFEQHKGRKLAPVHPGIASALKKGAGQRDIVRNIRNRFAQRAGRIPAGLEPPDVSRTYVLEVDAANPAELDQLVAGLKGDPQVEFAAAEQLVWTQFTANDPYFSTSGSWGQSYADLYGLHALQCAVAWDVVNGAGTVVAIVDTGIDYNHPDLSANVWVNAGEVPGNGLDDDGNGFVDDNRGWDFVGASYLSPVYDNNPIDPHGHGTHVAGTVAATGNNGIGVIGVAWGAKVMAVRGLDNGGTGTDAMLASAVVYAANNGADVINCSFGGPGTSQVLMDAVNYAHSLGCVVVVSAGNSDARAEGFFPASFPNVITVAATGPNDGRSSYSNWGGKLDVAAPGDDILSLRAANTSRGPLVGTQYTRLSGTSMAAPHVSGLAALILSQSPTLSSEQVRQVIRVSAQDVNLPGVDEFTGAGRVNAALAVAVPNALEAKIQGPFEGATTAGPITITGVAQGPGFSYYVLEYGAGEWPNTWTLIQQSSAPVNGGQLGEFDPGQLPDGRHAVRLRVYDASGAVFQDRVSILVDYVRITSPVPPALPSASHAFKAGASVPIYGTASGPSFSAFRVEWARGINPATGWTSAGVTLNGGASPVTNGLLASWD
ncbi:MAG: S8 family peptidase, partial [Verrucomicrobiota bacterium]